MAQCVSSTQVLLDMCAALLTLGKFLSQLAVLARTDTGTEAAIPLPNVSAKILSKVIEYCKFHVAAEKKVDDKPAKGEEEVKNYDTEFVKVDQGTLFELILVCAHAYIICLCTRRGQRVPGRAPGCESRMQRRGQGMLCEVVLARTQAWTGSRVA